jgi:dTMP kinase
MLILGARAAFVRDVVRPALERGETVLADRFSLSTLAYQGYGRGLDLTRVREAIDFATGGLQPDLYLVLDLPVDEGRARQHRDGAPEDRIEAAGTAFREAVRDGYLALAASEPNVEVVSARGTAEEVHARMRDRLAARFPDTFGPLEAIHPDRTV